MQFLKRMKGQRNLFLQIVGENVLGGPCDIGGPGGPGPGGQNGQPR